jgi:hypothetical protein
MPPTPAAAGTLAGASTGGRRDGAWKVLSYFAGRAATPTTATPLKNPEPRSDG